MIRIGIAASIAAITCTLGMTEYDWSLTGCWIGSVVFVGYAYGFSVMNGDE